MRGRAGQRELVPDQARGRVHRLHRKPGRVGVVHVGQHQHGAGMLEEAVGHFLQAQPHVLEADLLARDIEGLMRKAIMHRAHHAREHRTVADAGVEHAHGRGAGMDIRKLQRNAVGDHPFLATGVHEQQILLTIVEEAEIALRVFATGWGRHRGSGGVRAFRGDGRGSGS